MFEKWRIKEHMEVSDAAGQHIGTVDSVDGDVIKLTRTDSADGQHHYIDVKWVDKIDENRAWLSADAPLASPNRDTTSATVGTQRQGYDGEGAENAGFAGEQPSEKPEAPLFGTSGHGTGMGGSGVN